MTRVKRRARLASGRHQAHFPVEFTVNHGHVVLQAFPKLLQRKSSEMLPFWSPRLQPNDSKHWQSSCTQKCLRGAQLGSRTLHRQIRRHSRRGDGLLTDSQVHFVNRHSDYSAVNRAAGTPGLPPPARIPSFSHELRSPAGHTLYTLPHSRKTISDSWHDPCLHKSTSESHLTEPRPWPWIPNCGSPDWFLSFFFFKEAKESTPCATSYKPTAVEQRLSVTELKSEETAFSQQPFPPGRARTGRMSWPSHTQGDQVNSPLCTLRHLRS